MSPLHSPLISFSDILESFAFKIESNIFTKAPAPLPSHICLCLQFVQFSCCAVVTLAPFLLLQPTALVPPTWPSHALPSLKGYSSLLLLAGLAAAWSLVFKGLDLDVISERPGPMTMNSFSFPSAPPVTVFHSAYHSHIHIFVYFFVIANVPSPQSLVSSSRAGAMCSLLGSRYPVYIRCQLQGLTCISFWINICWRNFVLYMWIFFRFISITDNIE